MKMNKKLALKSFAWLVATTGLVWQLHFIIAQYLQYPINTEITFDMPEVVRHPSIYLTARAVEDQARVWYENGHKNLTIAQFYNLMPSIRVLDEAYARMSVILKHQRSTSKSLSQDILDYESSIINSRSQEVVNEQRVVYRWEPRERFSTRTTSRQPLHNLNLNTSIFDGLKYDFYVSLDIPPRYDLSEVSRRLLDVTYMCFTYEHSMVKRLGYPYTNCFDYATNTGYIDELDCFKYCNAKALFSALKVAFRWCALDEKIVAQYGHLPLRDNYNRKNQTEIDIAQRVEDDCKQQCRRGQSCQSEHFYVDMSSFRMYRLSRDDGRLQVKVLPPSRPDLVSTYTPKISLIDFFVYVLSSINFWLCVSPLPFMLEAAELFSRSAMDECTIASVHRSITYRTIASMQQEMAAIQLAMKQMQQRLGLSV